MGQERPERRGHRPGLGRLATPVDALERDEATAGGGHVQNGSVDGAFIAAGSAPSETVEPAAFLVAPAFLAAAFFLVGAFFAEAFFLAGAFFVDAFFLRVDGPAARRSARSSDARSMSMASTLSPLRRLALVVPSVT